MRSSDSQVRKMMEEFSKCGEVGKAAMKADMNRKTAAKYIRSRKLPSESVEPRIWRTRPDPFEEDWSGARVPAPLVATSDGFSLHAATLIRKGERAQLEKLCRYVTRPAICLKRLSVRKDGMISWLLAKPWRDGTKGFLLTPHEFIARLAAIVPHPREHQLTSQGDWRRRLCCATRWCRVRRFGSRRGTQTRSLRAAMSVQKRSRRGRDIFAGKIS